MKDSDDVIINSFVDKINDMSGDFNYLIIPVSIFNIIGDNRMFTKFNTDKYEDSGVCFIGEFGQYKCYVDIFLPPNQILFRYDKQSSREYKLDAILTNKEFTDEIYIDLF